MRKRGHDVRGGELHEAAHARIVLEPGRKHCIQWRSRRRLPISEHLAQLGGRHALAAQEFRQQSDAEARDRRAVQYRRIIDRELRAARALRRAPTPWSSGSGIRRLHPPA